MPTKKPNNPDEENLDPEVSDEDLMLTEEEPSDAPLEAAVDAEAEAGPDSAEGASPKSPEGASPSQEAEPSLPAGRSRLETRLREKYPDEDYPDDDSFYNRLADDYDDVSTRLKARDEEREKLSSLMKADPRSAQMLSAIFRGDDPVLSLVSQYGLEIRDAIDDEEMQDKIAEANKEYMERVANNARLEEEYNANFDESLRTAVELQQEEGLSDEAIDKALTLLMNITNDAVVGKVSKETLRMALKSINYDADVAEASATGEIRGRNANIKAQLRRPSAGDGTVPLNGAPSTSTRRPESIFDLAAQAR